MIKKRREYEAIRQPINEKAKEINEVLNNNEKERYFEKIVRARDALTFFTAMFASA